VAERLLHPTTGDFILAIEAFTLSSNRVPGPLRDLGGWCAAVEATLTCRRGARHTGVPQRR
jgi:hypothetical protein